MTREPVGENLAVLLTPAGSGAIAVIRIVGAEVRAWLAKRFSGAPRVGYCAYGELRDERGQVLDDIVVVLMRDGGAADLNLHGGPWVIESVRQLLQQGGFTFTDAIPLDAFDGDHVIEREMLAHLPLAKTEVGIRMLLAQPEAWDQLNDMNLSREGIARILADQTLTRLLQPARVAIIGIPNVGKSTLANQLFGQQRSITADMPGTTRDWVGELADVDGVPIVLLDTPGVRDSSDAIEQSAIALSRGVIASADLVIVVIDPTQPLAPQRALAEHYAKPIVVLNKSDLGAVDFAIDVKTIATTGEGLSEVRSLIRARLGCDDLAPSQPRWWTSRQRDELTRRLELPLEYASLPAKSGVASILLSVFVTTFCFAAAHLVAESVTGYLATFRFHWLGPASNPRQLAKLQDQYFFDMFTEVLWLVPATALVLLVQLGLGMYGRGNLRRGMWAMGLVVGLCYCWARWGLWGLSKAVGFPFPESANFLSSMLMAVASGLVLAAWRNRGHQ